MSNPLVKKQIIDKNGRLTSVWVADVPKVEDKNSSGHKARHSIPPKSVVYDDDRPYDPDYVPGSVELLARHASVDVKSSVSNSIKNAGDLFGWFISLFTGRKAPADLTGGRR